MGRGTLGIVLLGALAFALSASAGAGPSDKVGAYGFSVGALRGAPGADVDGDKIFDDLAARLEKLNATDRLSVIVRLRGDLTEAGATEVEQSVGGFELTRWLPIVDGFAATMAKSQVEAVAGLAEVMHVEANAVVHTYNDSAQAAFGVTQGSARCSEPRRRTGTAAWERTPQRTSSSRSWTRESTRRIPNSTTARCIAFANCLNQPNPASCSTPAPFDDNDHGTHVSGTIAGDGEGDARYKGVAPAAALVGVKVLGSNGSGSTAGVISGIQWVVQNKAAFGIEVMNLSLGSDGCFNGSDSSSAAVNSGRCRRNRDARGRGKCRARALHGRLPWGRDERDHGRRDGRHRRAQRAQSGDRGLAARVPGFNQANFSSRGPTLDGRIKPDVSAPRRTHHVGGCKQRRRLPGVPGHEHGDAVHGRGGGADARSQPGADARRRSSRR